MTLTRAQYREAWQAGVRPGNHILTQGQLMIWSGAKAQTLLGMLPEHDELRPILEAAMYDFEQNHNERGTE
jgi:hypothetical protein